MEDRFGFVYVLSNPSMPGLIKVGFTRRLPDDRASDLYTTSLPTPFEVEYWRPTSRPRATERQAHRLLNAHRVERRREFFRADVRDGISAVARAAQEEGGIRAWDTGGIVPIRGETR